MDQKSELQIAYEAIRKAWDEVQDLERQLDTMFELDKYYIWAKLRSIKSHLAGIEEPKLWEAPR